MSPARLLCGNAPGVVVEHR